MDKLSEKCAVAAVAGNNQAAVYTIEILRSLQHRGQEASGVVSFASNEIGVKEHREPGLVRDVYNDDEKIANLVGNIAIGHNRYSTSGDRNLHKQPVIDESIGFGFAHNGNLPNTLALESGLQKHNVITSRLNDSEMMARTLATKIREGNNLPEAIQNSFADFQGAFSCVTLHDNMIVAFRDSYGIRPLALGDMNQGSWAVSSETCGLDDIESNYIRDIKPGEMVILSPNKPPEAIQISEGQDKLDIFEFVYFAHPTSTLYGERVGEVRRRFGQELADEHGSNIANNALVVPVPETSIQAAEGLAKNLDLDHEMSISKKPFMGRTFITPEQAQRSRQIELKYSIIPESLQDRDIVLVDDSIVRLNTIPALVERVRHAGAKTVSVLIASPPVRYPDFYGIDTPRQSELAGAYLTTEQMRKKINAEYLGFLSLSRMIRATNNPIEKFNLSCFTGDYPIPIGNHANTLVKPVSDEYLD